MLELTSHSAEGATSAFVVAFLTESGCHPPIQQQDLDRFGAKPKIGTVTRVPFGEQVAIVVGCGSGLNSPEDFRRAAGTIARNLPDGAVNIDCSSLNEQQLLALAEGLVLGSYRQRGEPSDHKRSIVILQSPLEGAALIERARHSGEVVNQVRGWINTPANQMGPNDFAELAEVACLAAEVAVEVWDEERLRQERCGGILGVGAGSVRPPRLVRLRYGSTGPLLSLVGKGITFDTGGLSLKPPDSMVGMKYDMAGAATILGATLLIARNRLPIRVDAFLCMAENMPSGSATRPGDVLEMRNGKKVEVLNTDAEGRLVMADGLSLACESSPDLLIDAATLTGAASIALGNRYAGLMGTDRAVEQVKTAAEQSGELFWHMPMPDELRSLLDSEAADLANAKIGNRAGGMLLAAVFLREFVTKEIEWAHLDIASSANNSGSAWGHTPVGATGVGVRTIFSAAAALANRLG